MPYENTSELPRSVRNLPARAKTIYMKAFNSFWEENELEEQAVREKASHEAAWSAVKEQYVKDDETGDWVKIRDAAGKRSRHSIKHRKSKSSLTVQAKAHA